MEESKLINYSTADYGSKGDMELALYRWKEKREAQMAKLKAKGLLRFTILRIWNKDGVFRLGYLFEYKDEKSYKNCQDIWQEEERNTKATSPVKIFANRGIVLEDNF